MNEPVKGALAMAATSAIWGLSSILYKALAHVPALEVLAHRTLWAFVTLALILAAQGRMGEARAVLRDGGERRLIALTAALIGANWLLFILAVSLGKAVQSALGYYIFPLLAVLAGFLFLGERLTRAQWVAIALATLAVAQLALQLGGAPWFALGLALTFVAYGLLKRRGRAGPLLSVALEAAILLPFAAAFLAWRAATGTGSFGSEATTTLLLISVGPMTAIPLWLFSYAAKRIAYATQGLVGYINPTLQFLVAVFLFREAIAPPHLIAFALIWTALAIYSASAIRRERSASKAASSAGTSATS